MFDTTRKCVCLKVFLRRHRNRHLCLLPTNTHSHTIRGPRNAEIKWEKKNKNKLRKLKKMPKKKKKRLCSDQRPAVLRLLSFNFKFTHTFRYFTVSVCVFYGAHCIVRVCECVCVRCILIHTHFNLFTKLRERSNANSFRVLSSIFRERERKREQRYQDEIKI